MSWCFCKILSDRKDEIVLENDLAFAVYDIAPVSKGHLLIVPKRHVETYFDASRDEINACLNLMERAKVMLDKQFQPDGYNIGINVGAVAGQTVMHLHIHLIPRYEGDQKDPRGGIRSVIPEKKLGNMKGLI